MASNKFLTTKPRFPNGTQLWPNKYLPKISKDLWEHKTNIYWAINHTQLHCSEFDIQSIFQNKTYRETHRSMQWEKNILDYDIKLENKSDGNIFAYHETKPMSKMELHNFWAGFIEKKLGFKIKYNIYTKVIKTRFTNEYNLPLIDTLNELACVINEAIQLFDRFFVDKCVPHDSSFVKNFESLKTGILGDFTGLLAHFDENKAREATYDGQLLKYNPKGAVPVSYLVDRDANSELYQDFSKPIPGKFPAFSEITASGCFVEYVEFEISGLKTDFENTTDPRNIYGQTSLVRTSEMEMKLIENPHYKEKSDVKIGMIMFRDGDKSFKKYPESSRHIT
ncbi:uncharacterized protein LOC126842377 isoform X2 [Adelges cooleyi]|uniref:uncharacterized protein LOC126842377 isoform X2 n=1 Tax=Adelges cooleyi TaxID=133065 RepID=UPI00217F7FB8|nr:uncharacterized protein LOC126842377 isoform X2 [Adelges cooleyi]